MNSLHLAGICLIVLLLSSCVSARYNPDSKLAPQAMISDARLAKDTYFKNHPALDWYSPAAEVAQAFADLENGLTDSLTEPQFRLKLGKAMATIHCGHTSNLSSRKRDRYVKKYKYADWHFPLHMRCFGDSMVVTNNLRGSQSAIVPGDAIVAINGQMAGRIIDSLLLHIPGDGTSNAGPRYLLSRSFPAYYTGVYGKADRYIVDYIDKAGHFKTDTLAPLPATSTRMQRQRDTARAQRRPAPPAKKPEVKKITLLRNFRIDTARHAGIMELNTFSPARLKSFFRQSFREMRLNELEHLVLDLRNNGGGRIQNSTRLTRYLALQPFTVCDTLAARDLVLHRSRYVPFGFFYPVMQLFFPKKEDGRYHFAKYPNRHFQPRKKNHFNGNVFVITSGRTYSASTLFLGAIVDQPNVTVIGEETGGGAYGNSSTLLPEMRLPHTGVRIRIPLFRCVIDADLPKNGRGILPDHWVIPGSFEIRNRIDAKMKKALDLVDEAGHRQSK